jgi:hypothetical protein
VVFVGEEPPGLKVLFHPHLFLELEHMAGFQVCLGMNREVLITLCGLAFATLFAFAIAAALMIR